MTIDQIAAEAALKIQECCSSRCETVSVKTAIIQAAIEKATKPWRDAIGGISPVSEKPEKRNDILAEVEAKETGESRAAHAREPWTQETVRQLWRENQKKQLLDDEQWNTFFQSVADAHNATLQPAHATEQEKWHLEYEAGLVRVQKGHTILQSFPSQYAPSLLALSNAHNATLQPAHASELPFDQSKHHPSCTPHDQDLMWVCAQCGIKVPAHASEQLYRIQKGAELSYIPDWLIPVELGTAESTESYSELLAHKITHANEPTDQIVAEAAEEYYRYESEAHEVFLGSRDQLQFIIKSAIEKAYDAGYASGFNNGELAANSLAERAAHASEQSGSGQGWTVETDHNEPLYGWLVENGKRFGHRIKVAHLKPIADAHNATLQPAHASELSHDEIWDHIHGVRPAHASEPKCNAALVDWAVNQLNTIDGTERENARKVIRSVIETTWTTAHASDDEFIQCPSCGWHPVRKQ